MRPFAPSKLTLEQAYEAAYLWLFHIDQAPIQVVEMPPEMVELYSEELVTWVRAGVEVQQKAILAFLQLDDKRQKVIISAAGFSAGAISISESHGLALFTLRADGSVLAETGHAVIMMPTEVPPPPFAIPLEEEQEGMTPTAWGTTKFDSDVWVDCQECGTNQHVSLTSCRACGAKLVKERVPVAGPKYQCRMCGSHDIEVLTGHPAAQPDEGTEPAPKHDDKFDSRR